MADRTCWQSVKAEGESVVDRIKALIHAGNIRRVVIHHQGRTVAEFPLTAGVVGAMLAPVLAAIGALVALLKDCTIEVERTEAEATEPDARKASGAVPAPAGFLFVTGSPRGSWYSEYPASP